MKVLFDQGVPVPLRESLHSLEVSTCYEMGWADLANGQLIAEAEWMPNAPRYKRERTEPVEATGATNPQTGEIQPLEDGFLLEIEDPNPWAYDNEPIFWTY